MWVFILLVLLIPMETHHQLSQTIMGLTVIKWVGVFAVFAAIFDNLRTHRSPLLLQSRQGKFFVFFLLLLFIRWVFQGNLSNLTPLMIYISFTIFFFVTLSLVNTKERVRQVVWAIVICMLISSMYGVKQYYTQSYHGWRSAALFKDINYFSLSLVMAMPFAYYLMKTVRHKFLKIAFIGTIGINFLALVSTFSRGGFVGLAAIILVAQLISKKKIKAFIIISVLVVVGFHLLPERMINRFVDTRIVEDEVTYGAAGAATLRWNLVVSGLNMIKAHPLQGVGIGNFKYFSTEYNSSLPVNLVGHNTYIEIGAEMGLPILAIFLGMIGYTFRSLWRLRSELKFDAEFALLPNMIILSLTGFVVSATFISGQHTKLFWLLIFLTIALERIVKEQKQRENQDAIDVEASSLDGHNELAGSAKDSASAGDMMTDPTALPSGSQGGYSGGLD